MVNRTFVNLSATQAQGYAKHRGSSYPPELYEKIFQFHRQRNLDTPSFALSDSVLSMTPTMLDSHLDVGCGPGNVIFDLLRFFDQSIGIDPAYETIQAARNNPHYPRFKGRIKLVVGSAEQCGDDPNIDGKVDIITCAMAAHWFDMPAFYASAAKALKPGGTLAMWTCSSYYARHEKLQSILSRIEDDVLGPYAAPGNIISRNAYKDLPLPWTISDEDTLWDRNSFVRHDWDLDGIPSAAPTTDGAPGPYLGKTAMVKPRDSAKAIDSASMTIKWRDANQHRVLAGEIEDPLETMVTDLETVLHAHGREEYLVGPSTSLLLIRKV